MGLSWQLIWSSKLITSKQSIYLSIHSWCYFSNADWGNQVDVVGYCFMNLGSKYEPSEEFAEWIQKGSQPIYIGFGSMVGGNAAGDVVNWYFFEFLNSLAELVNNMFCLLVKPLDDSNKTTNTILEALEITGQRGIIDRGWGDLGNCKYLLLVRSLGISFCFPLSNPQLFPWLLRRFFPFQIQRFRTMFSWLWIALMTGCFLNALLW